MGRPGHCNFKPSSHKVKKIITAAVDLEKAFAQGKNLHTSYTLILTNSIHAVDAAPNTFIHMNATMMGQYIEFVADRLLNMLGYRKIYYAKNPVSMTFHVTSNNI